MFLFIMAMDYQAETEMPVSELANRLSVENITEGDSTCTESDDEKGIEVSNSNTVQTLSTIPSLDLSSSGPAPIGSVAITNSENVHFGNKTYFNGPITIKQYVHSKTGVNNESYVKTEEESTPQNESATKTTNNKKCK